MGKILFVLSFSLCIYVRGQYTKLIDLAAPIGSNPHGALIMDSGFLYGMTYGGGAYGLGTVFKIKPNGTGYHKLLDFSGSANGSHPLGSLISDGTFLYGMTRFGGVNDMGTIFKIKLEGAKYVKLLDFAGENGKYPYGSLHFDGTFLYGMTNAGGVMDIGVLFKIKADGTQYSKLMDFNYGNGCNPAGSLISDNTYLYGMTPGGGVNNLGTIFKIKPDGTGYNKLFDFTGTENGFDPRGSLVSDGIFLYGMAVSGGTSTACSMGCGTIFKIKKNGTGFAKLWDFTGSDSGNGGWGSLISDGIFLYGMTSNGGAYNKGTLFKLMYDGTGFSKLIDFTGVKEGSICGSSLIFHDDALYGVTSFGGLNDMGTIFKFKHNINVVTNMNIRTTEQNVEVYPNPCSEEISIRVKDGTNYHLEIEDLYGEKRYVGVSHEDETVINLSQYPKGVYFIKFENKEQCTIKKIIKQ